ncbi:hypothetical protein HPB51_018253 [Rhipicephalus microplus]|uniref:Uncharacterized protein n=1 Tax=Rhipicephalus microplus TaxID=6941 RepID=A0A9J6D681_RHIMP|nr:hypothetical protein HPB51_018253 [Rhipicephalus microplus]
MEREVVVDFAAGWNKHIVNTSSAICKPVRSSDKGLCMHQRADRVVRSTLTPAEKFKLGAEGLKQSCRDDSRALGRDVPAHRATLINAASCHSGCASPVTAEQLDGATTCSEIAGEPRESVDIEDCDATGRCCGLVKKLRAVPGVCVSVYTRRRNITHGTKRFEAGRDE